MLTRPALLTLGSGRSTAPKLPRSTRVGLGGCLLLLLACGPHEGRSSSTLESALVDEGISLAELLRPPTATEVEAVVDSWASRDLVATEIREEARFELPRDQVLLILSHTSAAGRHVGAVRAPRAALEGGRFPIAVQLPGLGREFAVDVPDPAAAPSDPDAPPLKVVELWPALRGHTLRFRDESWSSDGDGWDFCDGSGDDALTFLDAVLQRVPGADAERIATVGGSRGGNMALLLALREPGVNAAVSIAGPTGFFTDTLVRHPNASVLYEHWFVAGLLDGTQTVPASRERMARCSPLYFAESLPRVQLHHGTADLNLPFSQFTQLAETLAEIEGRTQDEMFSYPGVDHHFEDEFELIGDRVKSFLGPDFGAE